MKCDAAVEERAAQDARVNKQNRMRTAGAGASACARMRERADNDSEEGECPICFDLLVDPLSPCPEQLARRCCRVCVEKMREHGLPACPLCRALMQDADELFYQSVQLHLRAERAVGEGKAGLQREPAGTSAPEAPNVEILRALRYPVHVGSSRSAVKPSQRKGARGNIRHAKREGKGRHDIAKDTTKATYYSSSWEQLWLDNIETWQNGKICDALAQQQRQLRAFMNATCSARTDTAWCVLDDSVDHIWYNTQTGTLAKLKPPTVHHVDPVTMVQPSMDADIFSRFEWPNGRVEYIEPLVSHLRHPMMHCGDGDALVYDRSYVIPPPKPTAKKAYYFDAGASSWSSGAGGPSLSYFTTVWGRHGIDFDHIEGWEGSTKAANFYKTVPRKYRDITHYHQQWIASSPDQKDPFLPTVIRETTSKEDYVLFKLDIDNGPVEKGTVDHLLSDDNDDLDWIDEFVWEHHVTNYIMRPWWEKTIDKSMSIADSYQYFLRLRKQGVRAHSWV
jgi:hypothetical protein